MKDKICEIKKKLSPIQSINHDVNNHDAIEKVDKLNDLSYELRKSNPKKALIYSEEANLLASEISYKKGLGYSLRNMGICEWRLEDYQSSKDDLSKSINIFDEIGDKAGKASSLNGIGIIYRRQRDFKKSIQFYTEGMDLYKDLNDKNGEAISLNNIGVLYARLGNFKEAIRYYKDSSRIYIEIADKYGEAVSLNNIGFAYTNLGDYSQALSFYLKAKKIFKQKNDKHGSAETLTNIGLIYNKLNKYDKALEYEIEGLQLREEINDKKGQSNCLINIGNIYYKIGNLNQSLDYLTKSLRIKTEIGDREGEANALVSIAINYIQKKEYEKAQNYLNSSLKIQREIGAKSGEIVSLNSLGNVFIEMNEYDKAIDFLNQALTLAKQIKSKEYLFEINKNLSVCYEHIGNYVKALEYFKNFYEIRNKVFNEESDDKLRKLQVIHQVESLESEIQKLKNEELKHSLSELTSALDVTEIISRTDTKGIIKYVNENFCIISGFSAEELIGKSHRIIKSGYHPKEFYENLWEKIIVGEVWKDEIKNRSKKGREFWVDTTIVPLFDSSNKLTEFLAITNDITKRKEAEEKLSKHYEVLNRTNKELESTNKELEKTNKELDRFVYSASHDIRAPLTSVMGIVNLSKTETKSKKMYNYLDMIGKSVNRLDKFVIDIISYSRNTRLDVQKEKIDFDVLISDIILDLRFIEGTQRIEIKKNIDETIPFYSDKSRLEIILKNLISNAIRYHNLNQDNPYIDVVVNISKEKAQIQIKDNGIGIDRKHIDNIFNMFFKISSSNNSSGSGLGLYIVKETVDKLNGTVSIESKLNEGCTFTIEILNK